MGFDVRFDEDHKCVMGTFVGEMDRTSVKAYARELVKVALQHDCKSLLNDMRAAILTFSTSDLHELPKMMSDIGIDTTWRRAIVASEQLQDYHFFETTAVNRGNTARIFTNPNEAMDWLTEGQSQRQAETAKTV